MKKFFQGRKKLLLVSLFVIPFLAALITSPKTSQVTKPATISAPQTNDQTDEVVPVTEEISTAPVEDPNAPILPPESPTETPTSQLTATIKPFPTKSPVPTATLTQSKAPVSGGYICNCSKTCTEISSCSEAQYQLNSCGCTQRDNDNDGIACDAAPLHCQN